MQPKSPVSPTQEEIIRAWNCAFGSSRVIYLSGPINTGSRLVQLISSRVSDPAIFALAKEDNCRLLREAAKKIREQRREIVVEPASLEVPGWSQTDYLRMWEWFIENYASLVIFMPGWEYSSGCASEFIHAWANGVRMETLSGSPLLINEGISLLISARDDLQRKGDSGPIRTLTEQLGGVVDRLQSSVSSAKITLQSVRKDESLDLLANRGLNVAQFISFEPRRGAARQTFSRVSGISANSQFGDLRIAIGKLMEACADRSVNVRSYEPHNSQSREFLYGLTNVDEAVAAVKRLSAEGLHTIVNETINIADGGVSGVQMGNVIEFSPDDTPRCVEKPGTASLPRILGRELLSTVYGFPIELAVPFASRLEFSVHPRPHGWKVANVVTWEFAELQHLDAQPQLIWPNRFSRLIGDKAFGLLVAHHLGLPVPLTTVVSRRIAPFTFGRPTGWAENWIRTAPPEQAPGKFTTHRGWIDPFALLQAEDPNGTNVASVLSQQGVFPGHSGALVVGADGEAIIEGKAGTGDTLMLGIASPEPLPAKIQDDVCGLYKRAELALGPVRIEWVHDGNRVWVVQFHRGATESTLARLVPGEPNAWMTFDVGQGLEALRVFLAELPHDSGVVLTGRVGLTSHIADVVRKAGRPARMAD